MPDWFWTAFYGVLTAVAAWIGWRRSEDTRAASFVLVITWAVTNVSAYVLTPLDNRFFPFMDGAFAVTLLIVWRDRLTSWRLGLVLLFLAQIAWHVHYFSAGDRSGRAAYVYDLTLNALYVAQLGCVIWGSRLHSRASSPKVDFRGARG